MNFWEVIPIMIFAIPLVAIIGGLSTERLKMKLKAGQAAASGQVERLVAELAQTRTDVARLQDRVNVLERLITDEDRRVANEISRLGRGARCGRHGAGKRGLASARSRRCAGKAGHQRGPQAGERD